MEIIEDTANVTSNYEKVTEIVNKYGGNHDSLISILQDVQSEYQYLPEEALGAVANQLGLKVIQVYSVATFFKAFSLTPRGRHLVHVCLGTACHVRGATKILDEIKRESGIGPGETTKTSGSAWKPLIVSGPVL